MPNEEQQPEIEEQTEAPETAEAEPDGLTVSVGEMLAQGVHDSLADEAEEPEDDEAPADEEPETKPDPEPAPAAKPEGEEEKEDEPDEIEEALKNGDPKAALAHKLARKKGQRLKGQENELAERAQALHRQQLEFEQYQRRFVQQQQQFAEHLRSNPIEALKAVGQDPDLVLQKMSKQILDGEAPKPEPWEAHLKKLEDKIAAFESRDAEAAREAAERQRQQELAGHFNGVVARMVGGPDMDGYQERWPVYGKLTPVHREREAREALQLAYQQGYEGPIDELLDGLEEKVVAEYPYLVGGNGASGGDESGRAQDARTPSPPGNGTPAQNQSAPTATPDAVTGELAAESGSGNRRMMTERQRRAAARSYLSGGIIRD